MAKKKQSEVIDLEKRKKHSQRHMTVGSMIFFLIFLYMAFYVYAYVTRDKVQFYEVSEGSIVEDREYTGIILREESVYRTENAGYINYYIREGKRASVGASVYSLDESGRVEQFLQESEAGTAKLTDEDLNALKKQLTSFSLSYDDGNFSQVEDAKYSLEAAMMEYVSFSVMEEAAEAMSQAGINFHQIRADKAGVVSYVVDQYTGTDGETHSYSDLTPSALTAAAFDRSGYSRTQAKSGDLVEQNAPVYKNITSDKWSLVFPMGEKELADYGGKKQLHVTFPGYDLELTGAFTVVTGADGNTYGQLDFAKYMVQFESERFLTFEVSADTTTGLKIPKTSVTQKQFFLIPEDYLTKGGDSSSDGFMKETYSEQDGSISILFVPTTLYDLKDGYYYIDVSGKSGITAGDYLVKPGSTERFQVGQTASLDGVYNINKGYTVFRQVEILSSNDEYYLINKGTSYGLSVYDHIVLDASTVSEGTIIYQ